MRYDERELLSQFEEASRDVGTGINVCGYYRLWADNTTGY